MLTELEISFDAENYYVDESNTIGLSEISLSFSWTQAPFSMEVIPVTVDAAKTQYGLTDFLSLDNIAEDQEAESGG